MPEVNLSDDVVALSPLRVEDVDAHLAGEDELLVRWLNGGPSTRAGAEAYFLRCEEQWAAGGSLRAFGIRAGRAGGPSEPAGTIDLRFEMPGLAAGQVNVAYGLYPAWRGRGLATRAVNLVCAYAAAEGATQAVIKVEPENTGSSAVARRAGFTYAERLLAADGTLFDWYVRDI